MDKHAWDERYSAGEYLWSDVANEFVESQLGDESPGRALDLGAGEGRNAVWLARRGWAVTAVDFSAVGIEKGRRLAADFGVSVDFEVADVLGWELGSRQGFDLVVLSYLQLPREQRLMALELAAASTVGGGVVFVIAHDRCNVANGYGGPPSAEVCYSPGETASVLREAGLDIERSEVVDRVVSTPDGDRTALDTLVVARRRST